MAHKKIMPYLLILPIVLLYGVFIGGGLAGIIQESLGHIPILGLQGFTIEYYSTVISQNYFLKSLLYSIYIACTAAVIATVLGVVIAYAFVTCENEMVQRLVKRALQFGLIIPYLYGVFLAMILLNQTGFFARVAYSIGAIGEPASFPELIFDRKAVGIIWVFVFKGTPFISLFVMNVMGRIGNTYGDVAKSLGSGSLTILRKIYIPLASNSIVWTSSIIFAYALGSFEVSYLLTSISPVPLSAKLYSLFIHPDLTMIPQTMALSVILFVLGGSVVGIYSFLLGFLLKERV